MLLFTLLTAAPLVVVSSTTTTPRTFLPVSSLTKGRDELPLGPSHDSTLALPTSFDSRTKWAECPSINEIYDQSACGDCWAVSSVMTATDRWCIAKNQTENPRLSVEGAFLCCSLCSLSLLAFFFSLLLLFSLPFSLCRLPLPALVGCCHRCGYGCGDGFPNYAWQYGLVGQGVVTGGSYQNDQWCSSYTLPPCNHYDSKNDTLPSW